ncbi:MAG: acyl--CoA ligase [Gemmatimonadales bacterium]|nr:acyl--CoA ligase [Gemmatimonadales bacterium]MYG50478.1 acyl--CoA ligase [Gemmatimonadales bacterium]MYK02981.1 acyl--CoA ligase [Candidatus Palauibacter ramosifaciens]
MSGAGRADGSRGRDANLGYWLREAAEAFPGRVALIDLSRPVPREVTYAELNERMDRVANLLSDAGIGAGDRFALSVGNRFEFVEILFGGMRCGAVPVPLNFKLSAASLAHIVRDAACRAAFVETAVTERSAAVVEQSGIETRWDVGGAGRRLEPGSAEWLDYERALGGSPARFDPPRLGAGHPAFQPYTSGSTGKPKGVVLSHEGQLWWVRCLRKYWPAAPGDRALVAVPLYHKNAMAGAIKPLLQAGASVVVLPGFSPESFLRALSEYRCTQVGAVPAVFAMILDRMDLIAELDFSALRKVTLGSAPVQPELMHAVERAFGVEVGESYGLTEGGPVMIGPARDGRPTPRGSCGTAWPEGEIRLVRDGREDPEYGELWVRNPGVTTGYHNLPAVNAARIRDGWLATGDLFFRDGEGFYYFRGRTDDMFNSGGENIYPKEVEDLLLSHPDVREAAVVPVPHALKGAVPAAVVRLGPEARATAESLKRYTLERGPAYAHPRRIALVEEMPLTGVGKVDRAAILGVLGHVGRR